MSKYFFANILSGLKWDQDFVKSWIPLLENPSAFDEPTRNKLSQLGARSLAVVAMAAVEQYAEKKLIIKGTTDQFRRRALHIYQYATEQTAFNFGQITLLESFCNEHKFREAWADMSLSEIRSRQNSVWKETARLSLQILKDIQGQQFRKGHRGRQEVFGGTGVKPSHDWRNLVDAEIMAQAVNSLDPSMRNDLGSQKKAARQIIRKFLLNGTLHVGVETIAESVDKHAKRIYRKLEILVQGSKPSP